MPTSQAPNVPLCGMLADDNKISHVDPSVVSNIIARIEKHFGAMTVTHGDEHEFLGMRIKFDREAGTVGINMASYLQEAVQESGLDIRHHAATPATANHFDSSSHPLPLGKPMAEKFHSIVCKLLYVGLRAQTDILTSLSYLSTRITQPTEGDRRKLKRLLEYLHGTLAYPSFWALTIWDPYIPGWMRRTRRTMI